MKILLAVDASPSADDVIHEAGARPWPDGTIFRIIHVVDPFLYSRSAMMLSVVDQAGMDLLNRAADRLKHAGRPCSTELLHGFPGKIIVDYAQKWGANLLLVGSHGLSGFARFFLGGTAREVARRAHCTVEIVRGSAAGQTRDSGAPMKVLVATDGSEFSQAAVRSIAASPWPKGSLFRVFVVPEFIVTYMSPDYLSPALIEELRGYSTKETREALDGAIETLRKAGHSTEGTIPESVESPANAILREADNWKASLIVTGSHGRRGFDRLVMGSVAEAVAMRAHCSVRIYRIPQQAA